MASGVKVEPECKDTFEEMKLKHAHKYVIFRLSDDLKSIIVDCCGGKDEKYDDFLAKLKAAERDGQGRYAVYDCDYDPENKQKSKLVFIMWNPDSIKMKPKMMYASSCRYLIQKLEGIEQNQVQANDEGDIAWDEIVKVCKKYDK